MILVICAVAAELGGFERRGVDVRAVGVGPVEAAIGTTRAVLATPYDIVINAGIGGGFAGCADVGDAVAVRRDSYVEIGREDGGALTLPGGLQVVDAADSNPRWLERLAATAPATLRIATAVTSATITTTAQRAQLLATRYAPAVESMEGFAVLRAAAVAGVPALEVRGISNIVGDRAASRWDFRAGSAAAVRVLELLVGIAEA